MSAKQQQRPLPNAKWRNEPTQVKPSPPVISAPVAPAIESRSPIAELNEVIQRIGQETGQGVKFEAAVAIQAMVLAVKSMREIRDKCLFREGGFHSFREWCVAHLGERMGCWLDETL